MSQAASEPIWTRIDTRLAQFVKRRRRVRAGGVACLTIAACVLWLIAAGLADRFLMLSSTARVIAGLLLIALLALLVVRALMLLLSRRFDRLIAASQVERLAPELRDRLITVVTQQSLPETQRASASLTGVIAADVASRLAQKPPEKLITPRMIRPAIVLMVASVILATILLFVPSLDLPRLLARQVMPLADIPPVTTTRIAVVTGSVDLPQGQSLAIVADIARGDGAATLLVGADESSLQPVAMSRSFGDRFSVTLPSVERDLIYRVRAGDARSAAHVIRVLRRPALAKLQLKVEFPEYLQRAPMDLQSEDGRLEVVNGSRVLVRMQATEPLQSAEVRVAGQTLLATPTIDPFVRETEFIVTASGPWSIALVSDRSVHGGGYDDMQIVAVDDRAPVVQLVRTDLRLHPSDVVAIPFQAIDDFGIASLQLDVTTGDKTLVTRSINLTGDRRMVRDVATIDLAPHALSFGEVVTVTVTATDGAGQSRAGAPCRVLLSPRSVDPRVLHRIDALAEAMKLAETIKQQPGDASTAIRALLRVLALSDAPVFSDAITTQIDRAQQIVSGLVWIDPDLRDEDRRNADAMVGALRDLYRGEQARLLLAELENVRTAEQQKKELSKEELEAMRQSIKRARSEIEQRAKSVGLDAGAGDLSSRLKAIAEHADRVADREKPRSMEQLAREWVGAPVPPMQRDRVAIAAQAQVLRSDSDLVWARDLQLAARAMSRLQESDERRPGQMGDLVAALERFHRAKDKPDERKRLTDSAEKARKQLRVWAGEALAESSPATALDQALEKSAKLQEQAEVPAPEKAEPGDPDAPETWQPPAEPGKSDDPAAKQAQQLAAIAKQQQKVSRQTESASDEAAGKLGASQEQIAEALQQVEQEQEEDFFEKDQTPQREQALEALRDGQRALADLPQQLLGLRKQAEMVQQMRQDAERAQADAQKANTADKAAADRAAAQAMKQLAEAQKELDQSSASVAAGTSQSLQSSAARLGAIGKPISTAVDQQLTGAMQELQKSLTDPSKAEQEHAKVLNAVADLQATLRVAQRQATDRDPLVASRFFAQKAAEALKQEPPDLPAARNYQQQTSEALQRAWDAALAQSVKDKLQSIPAFQSLLADDLVLGDGTGEAQALFDRSATAEWGRLRERRDVSTTAGYGAFVPPGFEEALRVYFQTLDKAKSGRKE